MKLLRWFKEKFELASGKQPVAVTFDTNLVELSWTDGSIDALSWSDIERVLVWTTDTGPFIEDVFFVLETDSARLIIPNEAEGAAQLLERLQQLPGFDNEALVESMGCTDNRVFLCWERD